MMKNQELILKSSILKLMSEYLDNGILEGRFISWLKTNILTDSKVHFKKAFFAVEEDLLISYLAEAQNYNKVPEDKIKVLISLHKDSRLTENIIEQQNLRLEFIKLIDQVISKKAKELTNNNKQEICNILRTEFQNDIEHTKEHGIFYEEFHQKWEQIEASLIGDVESL